MKHTHRTVTIHYRGKNDSVDMECWCGKREFGAVWWTTAPPGWSKRQWPKLREAIVLYLESYAAINTPVAGRSQI